MRTDEFICIRALSEKEGLFSLDFVYCANHITPEWKQKHYFTNLSDLMQFIRDTLQDSEKEAEPVQRYRLNNWAAFEGRAIVADFESEKEATLCAAACGAQLYRITTAGGADLIYWPGKEEGRPAGMGGGASGKTAEE